MRGQVHEETDIWEESDYTIKSRIMLQDTLNERHEVLNSPGIKLNANKTEVIVYHLNKI